ncbi:MAG: energy-coupling factor transporter transmembrane component T family protein [Gallionella sp.]
MKFHPAVQILSWCSLVVAMQVLAPGALLVTAGFIFLAALLASPRKFVQLLRRTRWIMLSLLLIYGYSTPGQAVLVWLGTLGPSREGLGDGLLQLTRLAATLAGLAILLERLHRQQLIAGLYTLLAPLQLFGLSRERVAVRLALTLQYAEVAMLRKSDTWQDNLRSLFEPHGETGRQMELALCRFAIQDAVVLGFVLLMLWETIR